MVTKEGSSLPRTQPGLDVGYRYRVLSQLGAGGMGVVYRACDRLNGHDVALKRLAWRGSTRTPSSGSSLAFAMTQGPELDPHGKTSTRLPLPEPTSTAAGNSRELRLALAQEFQILSSLHHPYIINVLDYGFDAELQPYYVMELLSDAKTLTRYAGPLSEPERIELLVQVTQALVYLHRRGVLHRDLKPGNILVTAASEVPTVRVLDFGLALLQQQRNGNPLEIAGTLGYIAPEVLKGTPATEASDLYSLGIVAFELLTGSMLHPQERIEDLIHAILQPVALPEHPALSPAWRKRLERLLAAQPEQRPTASALLEDLRQLCRMNTAYAQPIRESFLQAASLVGRAEELTLLRTAMADLLQGRGQILLLAGESGVGKSRLCDELRAQALVEGIQVLRGQVQREVGGGLSIFVDALRILSLSQPLSPLEAGVIQTLIPNLSSLINCEVAEAPPLDAQSARLRLLDVLAAVLLRGDAPRLLFLEDLHWALDDAIELLRGLSMQLGGVPLLIIGTFRDDERPGLPRQLPGAGLMRIPRLSAEEIGKLSVAMLGVAGGNADLLDLLGRETEGNSLFIIEIVRALAVEAGGLESIGQFKIPERVYAGGIASVLQRRLAAVPAAVRPFLALAAVTSRQLDLNMLGKCHSDLDTLLQVCADASVLEVIETTWRFSHDKLREQILATLDSQELCALHRTAAEAILAAYPDERAHATALAYHYERGDLPLPAARYAGIAGEQALHRGALAEAVQHLERALALQVRTKADPVARGFTQALLVEAYFGLGQIAEASRYIPKALVDLGQRQPTSAPRRVADLMLAGLQQIWHQVKPAQRTAAVDNDERRRLRALCAVSAAGIEVYVYEARLLDSVRSMALLANSAERSGSPEDRVRGYAGLAYLFSSTPLHGAMQYFLDKIIAIRPMLKDQAALCFGYRGIATSSQNIGELSSAILAAGQAITLADQIGDTYSRLHAAVVSASSQVLLGQYSAAEEVCHAHLRLSNQVRNQLMQGLWLTLIGNINARRGDFVQADAAYTKASADGDSTATLVALSAAGGRVLCAFRRGQRSRAVALLEPALRLLEREPATSMAFVDSYRVLAEVALELWESASYADERDRFHKQVRRAIWVLRRYVMQYRVGEPALALLLGRYAAGRGRRKEAQRQFQSAISVADRRGMAYEGALARLHHGSSMEFVPGQAEIRLAAVALRQLGAQFDVSRAESHLQE